MVYPEVSKAIIQDIPDFDKMSKGWERVIAADFGIRNPTAVLFGAISPEGILYIYQMYYKADALLPEHAKNIKPMVNSIPAGLIRFMVGDPAMKNRSADVVNGKSVQALYQEYNLYFSEGNNRIEAGILRVNSYINRGRLKIFRHACADLVREITNYKYPELSMDDEKNLDENPIKYNDHACDALRYMMMRLPEDPDTLSAPSYETPDKWGRNLYADDDEYEDDDMKGDFLSYA